jgi:hypothetical protein
MAYPEVPCVVKTANQLIQVNGEKQLKVNIRAANVVQRMKARNIPAVDAINNFRLPTLSTNKAAMLAKTKL